MMQRILVTPRSLTRDGHPALRRLEEAGYEVVRSAPGVQPSEEEMLVLVKGCAGYLAGVEPVSAKVLGAAGDLRVISRNGTGIDNIDLEAAEAARIRICRAAGANARGVAELTIGLLLALARSIPFSDQHMKTGGWGRRKGFEVEGKTLGLVGFGKIGRIVARMACALGMQVLAYDPYPGPPVDGTLEISLAALDEVIAGSDIISLHCPSQPGKKPVIDGSALERMRRGVCLINTARADLIEAESVLAALGSGAVAGLAVDVFEQEPPVDQRIVQHERVIATPHIGGFTGESIDRATSEAVDNLLEALSAVS